MKWRDFDKQDRREIEDAFSGMPISQATVTALAAMLALKASKYYRGPRGYWTRFARKEAA